MTTKGSVASHPDTTICITLQAMETTELCRIRIKYKTLYKAGVKNPEISNMSKARQETKSRKFRSNTSQIKITHREIMMQGWYIYYKTTDLKLKTNGTKNESAFCPDLSLIKHIWSVMKGEVYLRIFYVSHEKHRFEFCITLYFVFMHSITTLHLIGSPQSQN